jgi:hypothetical protein
MEYIYKLVDDGTNKGFNDEPLKVDGGTFELLNIEAFELFDCRT